MSRPEPAPRRPYGRYAGIVVLIIFALVAINTLLSKQRGLRGIEPGHRLAPFAVPLAVGDVTGDADIATHANDGSAGRVPACDERGPQLLNVCELYERGPVVLALFVDAGACPRILGDLQAVAPSFPGVRFAAVSIKGNRGQLRRLVSSQHLSFPVGIDSDGALAALYKLVSCPQVSFAYPGGVVQSPAILSRPTPATLRARVSELLEASRARVPRSGAA